MKNKLMVSIPLIGVLMLAGVFTLNSMSPQAGATSVAQPTTAGSSISQAGQSALAAIPGTVLSVELDDEVGGEVGKQELDDDNVEHESVDEDGEHED